MAATALSHVSTDDVPLSGPMEFGAYKPMPAVDASLRDTFKKMPLPMPANDTFQKRKTGDAEKHLYANENYSPSNPLGFNDKDNFWLKELGIGSTSPRHVKNVWTTSDHLYKTRAWSDSNGGRLAIRTFSRGILGAAFFAAGQRIIASEKFGLQNYKYHYGAKADEQYKVKTPLDRAARFLDRTLGEGIRWSWGTITGDAQKGINAVTFRHTRDYSGKVVASDLNPNGMGRSYGDEALNVTFDFGMASLGDHMGRDLAAVMDPNIEKSWIKNGHIDLPRAGIALVKSLGTGLFRAMGEDYFAMVFGYPYVVRMSRNVINHYSPGFKYDSDNALNGGSLKISTRNTLDSAGKLIPDKAGGHITHPEVVGNYQMEGMVDLGFRFTVYNWLTKNFRDGYDWTLDKIDRLIHRDKSLHFGQDLLGAVKHAPYHILRNIIKMTIIMVPSMPFFFMFRSPQTKDVGLAVNIDKVNNGDVLGPIGIRGKMQDEKFWPVSASGTFRRNKRGELFSNEVTHRFSVYPNDKRVFADIENESSGYSKLPFKGFIPDRLYGYEQRYNPYGTRATWHDGITNFIGRGCHSGSQVMTEALKKGAKGLGLHIPSNKIADFSRRMVYASAAYTPYFAMKTDVFTAAYDTPRMDMAIDRTLAGAGHLKVSEMAAGLGEMGRAILGKPFSERERELKARRAQRALEERLAPGEGEQNSAIKPLDTVGKKSFASDTLKKKPLTASMGKLPDAGWQNTLRQFKELQPDGQAIN